MASSKTYLAYVRVSTAKQGEQGVSLQEQRDAILLYAEKQGISISNWFEERETAAKRGRPVFTEMLKLLRSGKSGGVIIHKVDRSARNLRDWADLGELIDSGVDVRFATESLDMNSRGGRLAADVQAVVAADFIRNLREEIRKGFYGRLRQGLYPRPAPLGYTDTGSGKPKLPDPARAPLVRSAFELYATGKFTLDTLVVELGRRGLRNRRGKSMARTDVSDLLNNPFYAGVIRIHKTGETFPGIHEPLVSSAMFQRVQALLKGKAHGGPWKHDYEFRRTFKCLLCRKSLIGERKKGRVYYRCHTRGCATKTVREDALIGKLGEVFLEIALTETGAGEAMLRLTEIESESATQREREIAALSLQLAALKDRLNRLTDAYLDGVVDRDQLQLRKEALLLEQKGLEMRLQELRSGVSNLMTRLRNVLELAKSAELTYEMAAPDERREMLRILTSNRTVDRKIVLVELRDDFQVLADRRKSECGAPQRKKHRTWDGTINRLMEVLAANPEMDVPAWLLGLCEGRLPEKPKLPANHNQNLPFRQPPAKTIDLRENAPPLPPSLL